MVVFLMIYLCCISVEYIYSPWLAPLDIQKNANCIIGTDYPSPMIDHSIAGTISYHNVIECDIIIVVVQVLCAVKE